MKTFADFRNEVSVLELALANNYRIHKGSSTKRNPVLSHENGDMIVIYKRAGENYQRFFTPNEDFNRGTVTEFVQYRLGRVFGMLPGINTQANINNVLNTYLKADFTYRTGLKDYAARHYSGETSTGNQAQINFAKIKPFTDRSFLYSRGINDVAIDSPAFKGRIFNMHDRGFNNTAFPYFSNGSTEISGFEIRNHNFEGQLKGSNRMHSIGISNMPEKTRKIFLTEGGIDAISHYQLQPTNDTLYVYFGGNLSHHQLYSLSQTKLKLGGGDETELILGFDKDLKGEEYRLKLFRYFSPFESAGEPSPSHVSSFRISSRLPHLLVPFTEALISSLKKTGSFAEGKELPANGPLHGVMAQGSSNSVLFSIPKDLISLQLFNDAFLSTGKRLKIFSENLSIYRPLTKDFNDDLKLFNQLVLKQEHGFDYQFMRLNGTSYSNNHPHFSNNNLQKVHTLRIS